MTHSIHFIRHGDVAGNADRRYVGTTDPGLTEAGKVAVDALGNALSGLMVSRLLCSPMARTVETCERLFAATEPTMEPALREIDFGDWENLTFDEISTRDPSLVNEWAENNESFRFPNGESLPEFRHRICTCIDALVPLLSGDVVIVTHGGVIRTAICHLLGLPLSNYLLFDVSPASLTTIQTFGEGGILKQLNYQPEIS